MDYIFSFEISKVFQLGITLMNFDMYNNNEFWHVM